MRSKRDRAPDLDATAADLDLLERFRWFRKAVSARIADASSSADAKVLLVLRQEPTHQLAEFLYLLDCQNIRSVEHLERLADLHNAYIVELTKDDAKMERLGLNRERLLDAMFTADTLPRLLQNWREDPGAIDQSNLARLLATVMSTETTRKVIVACAEAGFLDRSKTPYGTYLVRSRGTLERIFGEALREARSKRR